MHKNDSQRRYNVMLFSNVAFNKYLESTRAEIRGKALTAEYHEEHIRAVEGEDDTAANKEREGAQTALEEAWKAMEQPVIFYEDVSTHWATPESRLRGHDILFTPTNVGVGRERLTEDWAIIEIDASKSTRAISTTMPSGPASYPGSSLV